MEEIQQILNQIPIRHNLVSQIIFLGVVQGFFLSLVLLIKSRKNSAITFLGWCLFFQSLIFLDVYLCYTGLMKHYLIFNDSTEVFVLMIAPTFYFFCYCALKRKSVGIKKQFPHYLLPLFYVLSQIPFYKAPLAVKLNAYLGAYHTSMRTASVPQNFSYGYHWIKDSFDWLILTSLLFYIILGLKLVWDERNRIRKIPNQANFNKYLFTRNSIVILSVLFCLVFLVFYHYDDDGGDHYIAIAQTLIVFITSFVLLASSRFFEKSWFADKYETFSTDSISFGKIEHYLNDSEYHLSERISLKSLAGELDTSPNSLSKTINSELALNFNDYINKKRVDVAKVRLLDKAYAHLTVEAIGHSVGFHSKSAFYSAFKKHAKSSPAAFVKASKAKIP